MRQVDNLTLLCWESRKTSIHFTDTHFSMLGNRKQHDMDPNLKLFMV